MTHENKRCRHCAVTYSYQASGGGCGEPTNDPNYCPNCKAVILKALTKVPVKFKRDWVVTRDVTVRELVELEAQRMAKVKAEGGFPVRRVLMGLYDMTDLSNHNHRGVVRLDGKTYSYDYWEKVGMDAGQVCVEVEREVATGKITGPYELRDYWRPWPTLFPDEERGAECPRDPNVKVEIVPKPFPTRALSMGITRLLEDNSLANLKEIVDKAFLADVRRNYDSFKGVDISEVLKPKPPRTYWTIEELLEYVEEPSRTGCLQLLEANEALFNTVQGSVHNHQAWEGGYIDHVREVCNLAVLLYNTLSAKRPLPFPVSSPVKVLYLHDVEKPWKYQPREGGGIEEIPKMRGDKAAQHAFREAKLAEYGIVLTDEEANALRYVEGEMGDYSNRRRVMNELAGFCHACDVLSARLWHDRPLAEGDEWTGAAR